MRLIAYLHTRLRQTELDKQVQLHNVKEYFRTEVWFGLVTKYWIHACVSKLYIIAFEVYYELYKSMDILHPVFDTLTTYTK